MCELESSGPGYGPVVASRQHGNEHRGSINCWECLDQLREYRLLKDHAPWSLFVYMCLEINSTEQIPQVNVICKKVPINMVQSLNLRSLSQLRM